MCTGFEIGLLTLGAAGIGTTILGQQQASKNKSALPQLPAPPALPDPDAIKRQAKEDANKRRALNTKTILTGGAGIIDEPATLQKKILGG